MDIVEAISNYSKLSVHPGSDFVGLIFSGSCPFECKGPSSKYPFLVYKKSQTFECYSCGRKGDLKRFIDLLEDL